MDGLSLAVLAVVGALTVSAFVLLLTTFIPPFSVAGLVYARNAAHGAPFTLNPGQFSSGVTSALWPFFLAPAFLVPHSVTVAKLIGLGVTLAALAATYVMCWYLCRSAIASSLALVPLVWLLLRPATMLYESPLVIVLIDISILLVAREIRAAGATSNRPSRIWLGIVWALLALVRPDTAGVAAMELILLAVAWHKQNHGIAALVLMGAAAALPAACYYSFSYLQVGTFSGSATTAALHLGEEARHFHGFAYSLAAPSVFEDYPFALSAPLVIIGWARWWGLKSDRWLAWLAVGILALYMVGLCLVVPIPEGTAEVLRYVLPVLPLWCAAQSVGLRRVESALGPSHILHAALALLFLIPLIDQSLQMGMQQRAANATLALATDEAQVDYVNSIAAPKSTLLTWQIQDRYYLRDDLSILSLSGVSDGRILPYLRGNDIMGFLQRYRPRYWLADSSTTNPLLARSSLAAVLAACPSAGSSVSLDGITFLNLRTWGSVVPSDALGFHKLYELTYQAPSSGGNVLLH